MLGACVSSICVGQTSFAEGKRLYLTYCAVCHGPDGRGDGRVASAIDEEPTNLSTDDFLLLKNDRELKEAINGSDGVFHGRKYLPDMKVAFSEYEVFALVKFLRSFQKAPQGDPIEGRKLYVAYCSECHGRSGGGDGVKVKYLDVKPKDQSDDSYMSLKTDADLYNSIKIGGGAIHGARFMPQWQQVLRPKEIWDLVAYMRFLHRGRSGSGDSSMGDALFVKYCASCHGAKGEGDGPLAEILTPHPKSLLSRSLDVNITDQDLFFIILGGGLAMGVSDQMPAWGDVLTDNDVWNIVAFIRTLK